MMATHEKLLFPLELAGLMRRIYFTEMLRAARIALARHSFGNRQVSQSGKPHLQRKKPLGSS